jgi:endonuclease/exonuclease/phosphatase family metal-dependent hydrolase
VLFALALLLSLFVAYIPPKNFPYISIFSLIVSPLLLANVMFALFWLLRVKRKVFLSLIVLAISIVQFNRFYQFDFSKEVPIQENQLNVMSFNVRIFNLYQWIKEEDLSQKISDFIAKESPDVLSFQEYHAQHNVRLKQFGYKYTKFRGKGQNSGQAIYSKYPIVNSGSLDFENTFNNAIYTDIVKGKDTLRIYNIHLESLQVNPDDVDFAQENSEKLMRRIAYSFEKQQSQVDKVLEDIDRSPYKTIVTADLNNTAFSYVYRKLSADKNDAFTKAGKGIGKTFSFKKIPLRIDFIFVDKSLTVNSFTTYTEKFSDHFPISSLISW